MTTDNEQWKANGDCDICRRKSYCKKPCKKRKDKCYNEISKFFYKYIPERFENIKEQK